MTYDEYIPMYIKVLEARRTREVVTAQEWNNNFNLLIQQGDHTAEYLFELNKYLFVDDNGALPELITRAAATQEQLDIHENRFDNPHNVTATQTTTEAIPAVAGGNVQDVLADLKKQIDTKANDADAESKYEKKTDAARHIVDADCDDNTGIFTFYRADGSTFAFPTNLSKVVNNWAFDPITQKMIITLEDGTTQEVDLSAFITAFEFLDSDTIKFDIVGKNVSASIATDYLTAVTDQADRATSAAATSVSSAANATNSANAAASSATLAGTRAQEATTQASNAASYASMASSAKVNAQTAETNARAEAVTAKSYSEGGTGTRTGENTDNSKYYSELAKSYAQQAATGQVNSDWNETNPSSKAYIMNKPTVEQTVKQSANAVSSKAVDDALTSVQTTLNQSITTLTDRVTQTETDINDLADAVQAVDDALTSAKATLGQSITDLANRVTQTETDISSLTNAVRTNESELDDVKDALNGFKFVETSQAAWEALATKDPKTIYLFTS